MQLNDSANFRINGGAVSAAEFSVSVQRAHTIDLPVRSVLLEELQHGPVLKLVLDDGAFESISLAENPAAGNAAAQVIREAGATIGRDYIGRTLREILEFDFGEADFVG